MSERHKRCQCMNCCWRGTGSLCRHFARCIVSAVGCLAHPLRSLARRRHREYVRDDRAGVELVSVELVNGSASVGVRPYPPHYPGMVGGDGPREVKPFHKSWYPRYPTLLAISKALDELESMPKEKQEVKKDLVDKPEEVTKCEATECLASTSKGSQHQEKEQQYDWDVWSVESLEWNFDDDDTGKSGSSPSFG